jgi:hypothetical protein
MNTDRPRPDNAAWMARARWGTMTHYLADWIARRDGSVDNLMTVERWNALVDGFDVDALAEQVRAVGAGYHVFTIGQNSGFYAAPNETYDRIVGVRPSRCATRDLIRDLADALTTRGVRLLVYLPSGAPAGDETARARLEWQNGAHRNAAFQEHWQLTIREWSTRWGTAVHGWWFDGCYWPNTMYRTDAPPNFRSFAAAARWGNPDAAVAFNPGVVNRTMSITPHEDYIAGEVSDPRLQSIKRARDGFVDGARLHLLTYLGQRWGGGDARFSSEQAIDFTRPTIEAGGFVTWDVPVQNGGPMTPEFVERLAAIGAAVRGMNVTAAS